MILKVNSHRIITSTGVHNAQIYKAESDLILRNAEPRDISFLCALEMQIFPLEKYGGDVLNKAKFLYFLRKANAVLLVYDRSQEILGYCLILFKKNSAAARIYSIVLAPQAQGLGLGAGFLSALENFCKKIGIQRIFLETRDDNVAMQKLSENLGYSVARIIQNYYSDGMSARKYQKSLLQDQ